MKTPFALSATILLLGLQAATAQITYSVYCTREGLVGGTTANGHVITSNDHFVALPSKSVLNANGGTVYTVSLRNPANGRTASNVPVWDVGPWNTNDIYWATSRPYFNDLSRGLPEAQAAYYNSPKYNGGLDQKGRTVLNGSGIDLGDGTYYDLGCTGAKIEVTYNFVGGTIVDNASSGFAASTAWMTGTGSTDKYGVDYRYHSTQSASDSCTFTANIPAAGNYIVSCWYPQGSNRSATAPHVISTSGGSVTKNVNQQIFGGQWNGLGQYNLNAGANTVKISCWTTTGYVVMADAICWR